MSRVGRVVGIVLGAGSSRRLGRPKQTLPFGETTLLGRVVENAEASSLEDIVVVLAGAAADALPRARHGRSRVTFNDAYRSGCASSLLAGLDAAGPCDAVMLLLGDMPGVGAPLIDRVRAAWERERPWGAVTQYEDGLGHPFVFAAEAFAALRKLHGDKAVWKLVEGLPGRVRAIPVPGRLPADVDTWDDYERVLSEAGLEGPGARAAAPPPGAGA
jgi:molybdenum cofactor cytidylyltransferase